MHNMKNASIIGYIEGYYGRLLNWTERNLIISSLKQNMMNTYLYAPKEDVFHRLRWREPYKKDWRKKFRLFVNFAKQNKIKIIAGIAPGLDFDFSSIDNNKIDTDFNLLLNKAKKFLSDGASEICLLLDDIPNDFIKKFGKNASEGSYHAKLANKLAIKLNRKIFFVPRIYADELIIESKNYLFDLSLSINKNITLIYCGKNVVSNVIKAHRQNSLSRLVKNKIVFWDNFYANDYCPRRLFIGPWKGRSEVENILINPTGMIFTDLLILDIIGKSKKMKTCKKAYKSALKQNNIPSEFIVVLKFFESPNFNTERNYDEIILNESFFQTIDTMLWKWKCDIAREWYPYLMGLKQDALIALNTQKKDRIIKTQTNPLGNHLLRKK